MKINFLVLIAALFMSAILIGCGTEAVSSSASPATSNGAPVSRTEPQMVAPGADGSYAAGYGLKPITMTYTITGTVLAAPSSIQQYSVQGETHGYSGKYGGSVSGYIQGGTTGKGFVRFHVIRVEWHDPYGSAGHSEEWNPIVNDGDTVLLKTVDTKASALGAGDVVVFKCREQNEFVDAVALNEIPTTQSVVKELDYCRMLTAEFTPAPAE